MSVEPAKFVRWVGRGEAILTLVDEALALTWQLQVEHAVLSDGSGVRALVRGGRDGISFDLGEEQEARQAWLVVIVGDGRHPFNRIEWHTHPIATGPSDCDRLALDILGQESSRVYELGGEVDGTLFGTGKGKPRSSGGPLGQG